MKTKLVIALALLPLAMPVCAHRLDEYLQAILVSVEQNQIQASVRLIPGVAVSSAVIAAIDTNDDGAFSAAEQRAYAQQVLRDLSVKLDGRSLQLRLLAVSFPTPGDMKEGTGEIHLQFATDWPAGDAHRTLVVENHHDPRMSVYLMNCLVPQDHSLQVIAQDRNRNQSYYRVEYVQSAHQQGSFASRWRLTLLPVFAPFSGVPDMFRLGMHHIAEGTDHLLFLLALLLPAPLLAVRARWTAPCSIRLSLVHIVRVVSAFTAGHSLTLALGASGVISLPERPVEVLIAFSILISAAHALRPLFPGREPLVAAGFGLVHGLAFASTLQNLGAGAWQRLASLLGFNFGIETMQLIVVAAILPSLLLLSRTPAYAAFRCAGALFAALAAVGWIVERLTGVGGFVDPVVDRLAHHGAWMAAALFAISVASWLLRDQRRMFDLKLVGDV